MAVSTRPTHIVQVAFDDGALVASPTWTTIPARAIRVSRGRSDETQRFGPGTATVVVPNDDRLFDPSYSSGTYFGKLLPMRQLRVRATWNAVTYDIFRGHVEGWPQKYDPSNRDAYVELVANDLLTYLSNVDLPEWQALVATVAQPALWYPLDDNNDGEDFDVAREIMQGAHGVYHHDDVNAFLDFSQDPLAPTGYSVNFDGGLAKLNQPGCEAVGDDDTWSLGFAFARTTKPSALTEEVLFECGHGYVDTPSYVLAMSVRLDESGFIDLGLQTAGSSASVDGTTDLCDGHPHSVIITRSSTTFTLYIDGTSIGTASWSFGDFGVGPSHIGYPGPYVADVQTYLRPAANTRIDEVMLWNSVLSSTQAEQIGLALISFYGQTPATRAESLLEIAGVPSALFSLTSVGVTLGAASLGGKLLSELQLCEASEQGRLFVSQTGVLTLHSRHRDRTSTDATVSQATFADDGADHKYLAKGFEYGYEVDRLVNHCTVSGSNGLTYTATDSTSITAYGLRSKSIQTQLLTMLELRNLAEYIVLRYKAPVLRAKQFSVNAERAASTMWPAVLGLEIGDRITLQRTPQNVGSQISTALLVERIDHDIDQDRWETKLLGSPVDSNTESSSTYWLLGTSTFDSQTVLYF